MLKQKMGTEHSDDSAAPTRGLVCPGKRHATNATAPQKQGQRPARPEHWTPRPPQPKRNAVGSELTRDPGLGGFEKTCKMKTGLWNIHLASIKAGGGSIWTDRKENASKVPTLVAFQLRGPWRAGLQR